MVKRERDIDKKDTKRFKLEDGKLKVCIEL